MAKAMIHKDVTACPPVPPEVWLALELLLLYYCKASIFQLGYTAHIFLENAKLMKKA